MLNTQGHSTLYPAGNQGDPCTTTPPLPGIGRVPAQRVQAGGGGQTEHRTPNTQILERNAAERFDTPPLPPWSALPAGPFFFGSSFSLSPCHIVIPSVPIGVHLLSSAATNPDPRSAATHPPSHS